MSAIKESTYHSSVFPYKFRHFLFTGLKKQGVKDVLIQPYSGHESRKSLDLYSKLSIEDAPESYENVMVKFPEQGLRNKPTLY